MSDDNMGMIQLYPDGARIGIGGVGLFRNKRPYIWVEDGPSIYILGSLHPRITPEKFWELMEKVTGRQIIYGKEQ